MADKIFAVDKFLGINESADGTTELKLGEASKIENFYITDNYNLKTRPGICRYPIDTKGIDLHDNYNDMFVFHFGKKQCLVLLAQSRLEAYFILDGEYKMSFMRGYIWKVFPHNGKVCLLWSERGPETGTVYQWNLRSTYFSVDEIGNISESMLPIYEPVVISGRAPSGGGKTKENANILADYFYVEFEADGESTKYLLPDNVEDVLSVSIENKSYVKGGNLGELGAWNMVEHIFSFQTPPGGVVVKFHCLVTDSELAAAKKRFLFMPYYEHYNGATDTRIFFYGDGTNVAYYTGIPADGSGRLYVPAMNELAVDFSSSPITAMVRHYSKLLAFKPDGVDEITYEPMTLADGKVIAGFYAKPVNRNFGNNTPAQVLLVNNNPRSFSSGGIYEWRISSGYQDERYAKCISQKVLQTMSAADPLKLVALDDEISKTYYVFLNDDRGTVLVNRYDLDTWTIYRSHLAKGVKKAAIFNGKVVLLRERYNPAVKGELFTFDPGSATDAAEDEEGEPVTIESVWESGFMAFGAENLRKHSSRLWISLLPQAGSDLEITVQTDRRKDYLVKTIGNGLLDFSYLDFSNFAFLTYNAPKIKRVQLKVKKFVYYKLILRVMKPNARATVLGYSQQVRYSSSVK